MSTASVDLAAAVAALGLSLSDFARAIHLSKGAAHRLLRHGTWPARSAAQTQARVAALLAERRAPAPVWAAFRASGLYVDRLLWPKSRKAPPTEQIGEALVPATHESPDETPEDPMLLRKETLSSEAQKHFGLPRSLFGLDDIQVREDVLLTAQMRYVRAALMDAAQNNGFVAISGESGAGKSTLREEMEERIREGRLPVIVVKPWPHGMEPTEARGTPLRAGHIAEAIVHVLSPGVAMKSSPQARLTQIHELLKSSRSAGYKHLLLIEEAHRMPVPTLKHLKNFLEMKDGLRRLMGIALIGQTELQTLLSDRNPEVREIVQRCEQIALEPLDNDLEAYLRHKFERAGLAIDQLLDKDAVDAIRARLVVIPRGGSGKDGKSICYPQVVNNLMCRAFNGAARVSWPRVDAQVIAGV